MARPKLEPGTFGTIAAIELEPGRWKGDGRYRTMTGATRRITATGSSADDAIAQVKAKAPGGTPSAPKAVLTPAATLGELALAWLDSRDARREADVRAEDEGATTAQTLSDRTWGNGTPQARAGEQLRFERTLDERELQLERIRPRGRPATLERVPTCDPPASIQGVHGVSRDTKHRGDRARPVAQLEPRYRRVALLFRQLL